MSVNRRSLLALDSPWLFGPRSDILAFGGSALLAITLVLVAELHGFSEAFPIWTFPLVIVLVDVAHVWSTLFRVYIDREAFAERRRLYLLVPIFVWGLSTVLYAVDRMAFWHALAYVAVWHFVRQQAGWLSLYQRRAPDLKAADRWIDTVTIYTATLYPILWWHGHLPRKFTWFVAGDFFNASFITWCADIAWPVYFSVGAVFLLRQAQRGITGLPLHWGKILIIVTTWVCWWLGIIALNSDFAFTVTNVIIHGVPYFVLTYRYAWTRREHLVLPKATHVAWRFLAVFVFVCAGLAFFEEYLWDRMMWQEHSFLFGEHLVDVGPGILWVPLLSVPQATHYVLDGLIWKSRSNPSLRSAIGS